MSTRTKTNGVESTSSDPVDRNRDRDRNHDLSSDTGATGATGDTVELGDDFTGEVTLALALEESRNTLDKSRAIHKAMSAELDLFRQFLSEEKRERIAARSKKFDTLDAILVLGLASIGTGVGVAYHWTYALITVGSALVGIALLSMLSSVLRPVPEKR